MDIKNSKLFQLYSVLSQHEAISLLNDFKKRVTHQIFIEELGKVKDQSLSLSKFHIKINVRLQGKQVSPQYFRKITNDVTDRIKARLVEIRTHKNPHLQSGMLLQELHEREIEEAWDKFDTDNKRIEDSIEVRDSDFYLWKFHAEEIRAIRSVSSDRRPSLPIFEQVHSSLDHFFMLEKLKFACAAISQDQIVNTVHELWGVDQIIARIERENLQQPEALIAFYHAYKILVNKETDDHYQKGKEVLLSSRSKMSLGDRRNVLSLLLNYITRKSNSTTIGLAEEFKTLFNELIIISKAERIFNPFEFKNMIIVMSKLGDLKWVKEVIEEFGEEVYPKKAREDDQGFIDSESLNPRSSSIDSRKIETDTLLEGKTIDLHLKDIYRLFFIGIYKIYTADLVSARILFGLLLNKFDDVFFGLNDRGYYLICNYLLDDSDRLGKELSAIERYISRKSNKIPEHHSALYKNFCDFLHRLHRIKTGNPDQMKKKAKQLLLDVNNCKEGIAQKGWLINEIEKLN